MKTILSSADRMTPEILKNFLDALPEAAGLVDSDRRFLHANKAFIEFFGLGAEDFLGNRPGSVFHCIHCDDASGGCGETDSCRDCGTLDALVTSFKTGAKASRECRLSTEKEGRLHSYDLLVTASPLKVGEAGYSMVILSDQSGEKRRRVLERLFFHDLINTVGGLAGLADVLGHFGEGGESKPLVAELGRTLHGLLEEVAAHRDLFAAERGDLEVHKAPLSSLDPLREAVFRLAKHPVAEGKKLVIDPAAKSFLFVSDGKLLGRILVNMAKNALEACAGGEEVVLSCRETQEAAVFSVSNPEYMKDEVRRGVFQRSFTTKGTGRGLGTYGMKLFAESYLGGKVRFESTRESGTVFYAEIPKT